MNLFLTIIHMYIMLTYVYPFVKDSLLINNKLGLGLFIIVNFLAITIFNILYYKNKINLNDILNKIILNSLIIFTTVSIIRDDLSTVSSNNQHIKYLLDLTKNENTKHILTLSPFLLYHLSRALLKPY